MGDDELTSLQALDWIQRWDAQQECYAPHRLRRWDVVVGEVPDGASVLDLGCGPGSLTRRLGRARPTSRVDGIDADPLLVGLARIAYGSPERWHVGRFDRRLPDGEWDVVVSSTTLHYLAPPDLRSLLTRLRGRVGMVLNADHLPSVPGATPGEAAVGSASSEPWDRWWSAARATSGVWSLRGSTTDLPAGDHHLTSEDFAALADSSGWTAEVVWHRDGSTVIRLT